MDETRPRCLVVLTALRFSEAYGRAALASAEERGEDVVLCLVVDREISEQVAGQLGDVGFLGEKLTHDLQETMLREYRERGQGLLDALAVQARERGIGVETRVVEGPFLSSVLDVARERGVARIVVTRMARPHVSRLFFGSEVARLVKRSPIPVQVYAWSGKAVPTRPPAGRGSR